MILYRRNLTETQDYDSDWVSIFQSHICLQVGAFIMTLHQAAHEWLFSLFIKTLLLIPSFPLATIFVSLMLVSTSGLLYTYSFLCTLWLSIKDFQLSLAIGLISISHAHLIINDFDLNCLTMWVRSGQALHCLELFSLPIAFKVISNIFPSLITHDLVLSLISNNITEFSMSQNSCPFVEMPISVFEKVSVFLILIPERLLWLPNQLFPVAYFNSQHDTENIWGYILG